MRRINKVIAIAVVAGLVLLVVPTGVAYSAAPKKAAQIEETPLFAQRLEEAIARFDAPPPLPKDRGGEPGATALSAGVSGCLSSLCVGSGCVTSYCIGSVCLGSWCAVSICFGSWCGGTACAGSNCPSQCNPSTCTGTSCTSQCESSCLISNATCLCPSPAL